MPLQVVLTLVLPGVWVAWVGFVDWRSGRIPNAAILIGIGVVCIHALIGEGVALRDALLGVLLSLLLFFPGYYARALGAGDVKLGIVAGLLWGSAPLLVGVLFTGLVAAVTKMRKSGNDRKTIPVATWFLPGAYMTWMIPIVFQPIP